jgi:acetyl esterase/lipase
MKSGWCATTIVMLALSTAALAQPPGGGPGQPPRVPPVPPGTTVHRDLAYVTNGHPRQKLDLYLPAAATKAPLIVMIHGGAFKFGSKEGENPVPFLSQGYAVASLNYRLSGHARFPAQIEDCKAAVRWLRAHAGQYGYDPDRFGAWGASAGGHLVTMLGTTGSTTLFDVGENLSVSSRVQAVADNYGPTDFLQMDAHRLPDGMAHDPPDSPESELIGGALQDNPEKVRNANPITHLTRDCPPFLVIHGDRDPLVPHHQSELLVAALRAAGVPVTFYTVKGGGHGGFTDPKVEALTRTFFADHLQRPDAR